MSRPATRNYGLLFAACVAFHVLGTWSLPLVDRDEPRFAEASREMRERREFIVPYFNNEYRFDKPPLTYWFQVASYSVFGENDFAARFPTAMAAAATAVLLLAWGWRMQDAGTGWWAAATFTLCLQTFLHGKAAVADMWLVLFVTAAHWSGWEMLRGKAGRLGWWAFYVALALAFLAKGPIGWTPIVAVLLARRWFARSERPEGRGSQLHIVAGAVLMLAIVSAWGIPALLRTHGEFFRVGIGRHVVGRSLASMEGHGANSFGAYLALLPFYFVTVFASFFPWSLRLPALCRNLWQQRDATDKFLLTGVLLIFGVFTLVKTKLPHYTLAAFPLMSLLLARRAGQLKLSTTITWVTAIVLIIVSLLVPPLVAPLVPSRTLALESRQELRPEMDFAALDYTEPSLVWYFRRYVHGFMSTTPDPSRYMAKPGPRFVIFPTEVLPRFFPELDPSWRMYRAEGWNFAKGKRVNVTMIVKER